MLDAKPLEDLTTGAFERIRPELQRPRVKLALRIAGVISAAAVLASFAFGVLMVATMVRWCFVAAAVMGFALLPAAIARITSSLAVRIFFLVLQIALVPIVGLLAFNVMWASAGFERPDPAVGLLIASVVLAGVAFAYMLWLGRPAPSHPVLWALFAFLAALGLRWWTRGKFPDADLIGTAAAVGFATLIFLYSVAGPKIVHPLLWTLFLVLVAVFFLPLLGEAIQGHRIDLWVLIGFAAIGGCIAVGVLGLELRTANEVLLIAFGIVVVFGAVLFAALVSGPDPTPDSRNLPVAGPGAPVPDIALTHRPLLLFDTEERLRTPLDVDKMFETGFVELCPEGTGLLADCRSVDSADDLKNGFGNLRFETKQIEDEHLPTTMYVHVVRDKLDPELMDLDYWWYLPDNPAYTARGAMCGAGFVIPEITCFDHQSDWEGVTVVVRESTREPEAVHYAAHDGVVKVDWDTLQEAARRPPLKRFATAKHPPVFVALGTHASYPTPCAKDSCRGGPILEDNRHDGAHEWPCNGASCVTAFPTRVAGGKASWNAFDGLWGSAICITKDVFCSRADAPRAPGKQRRYRRPWCYDFEIAGDLYRTPKAHRPAQCPKKKG